MVFGYNLSWDGSPIRTLLHAEISIRCDGLAGQWFDFRHAKQAQAAFTFSMELESPAASQSCLRAAVISIHTPQFSTRK